MQPLQAGDPAWVGPYQSCARLGAGGMGTVLLSRSPGGRLVALKLVRAEFTEDQGFRERFRREVDAARRVGGVYTAPVLDADPDAPHPWLAVAYVPAPTLREAVAATGPLPEAALRALGAGLAEALQVIHRAGLIHRDLKPSNILLAEDGPKVIDFGITRAVDASRLTATGGVIGTPAFMPPEQIGGRPDVGPASDVFSLAGVLVYAASGTGPFGAGDSASLLYEVMYGGPRLDAVPGPLRGLLTACLSKEPDERPPLADVLGALLPSDPAALTSPALRHEIASREATAAAMAGGPVVAPPPLPQIDRTVAHDPGRRLVLRLAAATAVGVVGAGGGATAWALTRDEPASAKPAPRATGLVAAPAPVWSLDWPRKPDIQLRFQVEVTGNTVVWREYDAICGVDAASGRRLWTLDRRTGRPGGHGFRVFGGTILALGSKVLADPYELLEIDAATGNERRIAMPDDAETVTDVYGLIGRTAFVSVTTARTGKKETVLAVDLDSSRVLWRYPGGTDGLYGVADGTALYLCTPTQVIGIDAATGARKWAHTWFTDRERTRGYPLLLGSGLVFIGATGSSILRALRTTDGTVAWSKNSGQGLRPAAVLGSDLIATGEQGFHAFDQATGAARWQQTSSPSSLQFFTNASWAGGSDQVLAAVFGDSGDRGGFFAARPGGGPSWAYWGPSNDDGWSLAVSGPAVYATDNKRLYRFPAGV
ncbi:PQQ-binding-like beta-propeller repeat protein [Spirillospora sp. NPDC047279]|uniref:protein kinase domain-containing protein n=1 Tax=Spirillospora sp. NPDC047279 TaxID=3155478 RepID=UPI0033F6D439